MAKKVAQESSWLVHTGRVFASNLLPLCQKQAYERRTQATIFFGLFGTLLQRFPMRTACDSASPIFVLWLNLVYALIFFVFESTNLPSKYFFGCHDSGEVAAATTESKTTFFPTNRAGRKCFTFFVLYSLYLDDNELTPFIKAERRGKIECPFVHDAACCGLVGRFKHIEAKPPHRILLPVLFELLKTFFVFIAGFFVALIGLR